MQWYFVKYLYIFTLLELLSGSIVPFLYRTVSGASRRVWIQWTDHVQTPSCQMCQELCLDDRWERVKHLGNQNPLVSDWTGWWIIYCVLLQFQVLYSYSLLMRSIHGFMDLMGVYRLRAKSKVDILSSGL